MEFSVRNRENQVCWCITLAALLSLGATAHAAPLVTFDAAQLSLNNGSLSASGAITFHTAVAIEYIGATPIAQYGGVAENGGTRFTGASLELSGLTVNGDATWLFTGFLRQYLNDGHFILRSADLGAGRVDLLVGDIDAPAMTGYDNAPNAGISASSPAVQYTAGELLPYWTGGTVGGLAWTLATSPSFHQTEMQINNFQAAMTGDFNAVPEPSSLVLLGLSSLCLVRRHRRAA
jgi:hypothetical protein